MTDTAHPQPDDLVCLLYTSEAVQPVDLAELVRECRARNLRMSVTGLLLYHAGTFLQCLEGRRADVLELYEMIKADHRHEDVTLLSMETLKERQFGEFAMAFRRVSADDFNGMEGFSTLLETEFARKTLEANPEVALQVIMAYAHLGLR